MSEKKGKITLSGLTKGGSSNAFLSFRFSPESEEIQEIMQDDRNTSNRLSESAPASPKPSTSGDVSPLKEYLMKEKHKWTNKWDKKSLSLDLDLKGKIKTAIEDRKKSILSNFIPEETGIIPQSQSIPENIATRVYTSNSEDISQSEGNIANSRYHEATIGRQFSTNSNSNSNSNSSGDGSQETLDGGFQSRSGTPSGALVEPEEVGVDMMDYDPNETLEDSIVAQMCEFLVSPHEVFEHFGGLPTLYQPTSIVSGVRLTPSEHDLDYSNSIGAADGLSPDSSGDLLGSSEESGDPSQESIVNKSAPTNPDISPAKPSHKEDLRVSILVKDIIHDIFFHPWSKYLFGVAASIIVLPTMGFLAQLLWFLLGVLTVLIIGRGLSGADKKEKKARSPGVSSNSPAFVPLAQEPIYRELKVPMKSQGWMTQMDGEYDVDTCHMRQTKIVFVRLDGCNLYLAYPHPKFRIPKRRLWNDPPVSSEFMFVHHKVYNLSGAEVSIIPNGLARRRVWNKKYPIGITFGKWTVFTKVAPSPSCNEALTGYTLDSSMPSGTNTSANSTTVNYNVNSAGISVKNSSASKPVIKKDVEREDCSLKTIHLFARCDREKDDWYRRLINAAKLGPSPENYERKTTPDPLAEYREYMKRVCPLIPFTHAMYDEYDNVSMRGNDHATPSSTKDKGTPSSSRKTTPEKDKLNDFENILTIPLPQSPAFLNALVGRVFFDFLKSPHWKNIIVKTIDKKLFYMKKPPFINDIHVKELDMGNSVPLVQRASAPVIDHQGLWIDLDLTYEGTFCVSLVTHVNILNYRKTVLEQGPDEVTLLSGSSGANTQHDNSRNNSGGSLPSTSKNPQLTPSKMSVISNRVYDSDADDSGESSEDEDEIEYNPIPAPVIPEVDPNVQTNRQKLIRWADKIATSSLMNRGVVKKMVDNLGATPLVLSVELRMCAGTMALNVPPPPNDRLWLGFRTNPEMDIVCKPKFGDRTFNFSQVTDWIKRKLLLEFQRVFVCPNMNDITIPLMEFSLPK